MGHPPLEPKSYGPDSSEQERAALRARVEWHEDGIVEYHEVPTVSEFQIDIMFDEVERLVEGTPEFGLLIDLTEGGRPDASVRRKIQGRVELLGERLAHVAVYTGGNAIVVLATRLLFKVIGWRHMSWHISRDEAVREIGNALQ